MTVEVNVVGIGCGAASGGLSCTYCYQASVRRASGPGAQVDHERVQAAVLRAAGPDGFTVFGGEPLLAPVEDLEKLWSFGFERYGKNGVQTSGRPIRPEHFPLFKRYNVYVGFSIDGPAELNDARVAGGQDETRAATRHSIEALEKCLALGISTSLIVTLHRLNASAGRLPDLLAWFRWLDLLGLRAARLHLLERDGPGAALALSPEDNAAAMLAARELERELSGLRFDVFADIEAKLRNPDASASCTWNDCDPWTTPAVHGINADGSRSLCQRVHKDGRAWLPADGPPTRARQVVLWSTPQAAGGCQGCRFFLQCGGQCPGTAIGGDWRFRSVDCSTWFALLEVAESEMLARGEAPASLDPNLPQRIAARLGTAAAGHADTPHGDSHGDEHGDHTDA